MTDENMIMKKCIYMQLWILALIEFNHKKTPLKIKEHSSWVWENHFLWQKSSISSSLNSNGSFIEIHKATT